MKEFKAALSRLQARIARLLSAIFSNLFCIFGIGLTSLVAKTFGKKFLRREFADTSWLQTHKNEKLTKQY